MKKPFDIKAYARGFHGPNRNGDEGALDDKPKPTVVRKEWVPRNPSLMKEAKGYVYYASDEMGRVKIGFSCNPWSRVKEMEVSNPGIKIFAMEPGTRTLEDRRRHKQFAAEHVVKEWFTSSDRLMEWTGLVAAPSWVKQDGKDFYAVAEVSA